jgi:hypothetical protein
LKNPKRNEHTGENRYPDEPGQKLWPRRRAWRSGRFHRGRYLWGWRLGSENRFLFRLDDRRASFFSFHGGYLSRLRLHRWTENAFDVGY